MGKSEGTEASATTAETSDQTSTATLLGDKTAEQQTAEKPAADATKTQAGEAETKAADQTDKTDEKPPVVPEKYELKIPEGYQVLDEDTALFKEMKLTNEAAQTLCDRFLERTGDMLRAQAEAFQQERAKEVNGWMDEVKNAADLQGTVEIDGKPVPKVDALVGDARKALGAFGTPEQVKRLKADLDRSGMGNHPILTRGLALFRQFVGDDNMIIGRSSSAGEIDAAKKMYPNQA